MSALREYTVIYESLEDTDDTTEAAKMALARQRNPNAESYANGSGDRDRHFNARDGHTDRDARASANNGRKRQLQSR